MMIAFLIAGIALIAAGLLTLGLGIQIDLSFGNALIFTGALAAFTGVILIGLWAVLRELREISRRLGGEFRLVAGARRASEQSEQDRGNGAADIAGTRGTPSRQQGGDLRERSQPPSMPDAAEAAPAPKARRHLLFSSSLRKEREQERSAKATAVDFGPEPGGPGAEVDEAIAAAVQNTWPRSDRARSEQPAPPPRSGRALSTPVEANRGAIHDEAFLPAPSEPPPVTVLKSGIVDGMAYSLYSDGSIEAQMPEGMMRFASIEELRTHLDQRP